MATRTFKERKNNKQAESFFQQSLNVYINVEKRERARARNKKKTTIRRPISLEEKHGNFIAAVRKWEILASTKWKKKGWTGTTILISAGKQRVAKCGIIVYFQISYWRKKIIYSYYNVPIFIVFYLLYLLMSSWFVILYQLTRIYLANSSK